jgi:hypothetical protein
MGGGRQVEWRGERHELHASALPLIRARLPRSDVELRADAGGEGEGLVATRAFATNETVIPWEVPSCIVGTSAAGAPERIAAHAQLDPVARMAVVAQFCRPDPAAFPEDPCVKAAVEQVAAARVRYPDAFATEIFKPSSTSSTRTTTTAKASSTTAADVMMDAAVDDASDAPPPTDLELVAAALSWRFNAHAYTSPAGVEGAALFILAAKANSSCDPNLRFETEELLQRSEEEKLLQLNKEEELEEAVGAAAAPPPLVRRARLVALRPIGAGETLTICYLDVRCAVGR